MGVISTQLNANVLTRPEISGSTYTYRRLEAGICAPLTESLLELGLRAPLCLGLQ